MAGFIYFRFGFLFLLIGILQGCISDHARNPTSFKYPDLPNFFLKEAEFLNKQHAKALKTTIENGTLYQSDPITQIDWKREFVLFMNEDLNKPVYDGKLKADSVLIGDTLHIEIQPLSEKLPLKNAQIKYVNNQIVGVFFLIKDLSPLAKRELELRYIEKQSYHIRGFNAIMGNKTMNFDIQAEIIL